MAGSRWFPVFVNRFAAEYQSEKIARQVTKDEEHDCPGSVSKRPMYIEEAEIKKENSKFVQP